jgi:hypothetical protein
LLAMVDSPLTFISTPFRSLLLQEGSPFAAGIPSEEWPPR